MNFENYKTCHGIMISCMDTMVKNWESFAQVSVQMLEIGTSL